MRRWISEPLLTGAIAIVLYTAWMLSYSSQRASTGVSPSGGSYLDGWDLVVRMFGGVAIFAMPVVIWAGLAIGGGFLVRRRGFGSRLLMAWLAAVVLCLPFAVAAAVSLSASDGWGGLGVLRLLIPAAVPFLVAPLYCVAAALLHFGRRRGATKKRRALVASE
jgi:hypothetical protein